MHITRIKAKNFRLINEVDLQLDEKKEDLSLLIGRNNSGKTSFIVLLEKFLKNSIPKFSFDDFPIGLRDQILNLHKSPITSDTAISLLVNIRYDKEDSLANISSFLLDLAPKSNDIKIYFESVINQKRLITSLSKITERHSEYIKKNIGNYIESSVYALCDESDIKKENRINLVKKDWKDVSNLINIQVIHAKRDVASSEANHGSKQVLSKLTTNFYNKNNQLSFDEQSGINQSIIKMDSDLDKEYEIYFEPFLKTAKNFLNIDNLLVKSDLQSQEILANHSKIVYGDDLTQLPENLNGLGYLNILYLLLQIEIKKAHFKEENKEINLLFIEEPEAHTHPQMQYIFIEKIKSILFDIPHLQTMITSHSPHIVNRCDFKSIRYFLKISDDKGIIIKNFYNELLAKYSDEDVAKNKAEKAHFTFLQQYLTLNSSELFFAEKIIFIEGTTEKLLLPLFIKLIDDENHNTKGYRPLSSQNISILEVGANSKAFRHFLEFLNIKTLIITDIDTTKAEVDPKTANTSYKTAEVKDGTHTSNYSIKYFLKAPDISKTKDYASWMIGLKENTLQSHDSTIKLAYQTEENKYQGRSFEDAFISVNFDLLKLNKKSISGLKNKVKLDDEPCGYYDLTNSILDEKSAFASSLLWLSLTKSVKWNIPAYIKNNLLWMAE
jgi:putative ATP-dependent endonuclease of OLD family